ncbi:probable serine/threonine-protein phosphatase 4 regulatory subunit at N-terminal half [Coccomyxa sp. Obi]|nr:probable serine/threonine-protein phosphatase 4 regulatory subunit at N-terminal half [Coccomyxa sp. Obi]
MDLVADEDALRAFEGIPDAEKKLTPALRGVLAEIATTGIIRYEWRMLQPLIIYQLHQVLVDYDSINKVEIGPMPPQGIGESVTDLIERLTKAVCAHTDAAPFTLQRLAELLLEPQKQYARLDKLALALEKLLLVTSTIEPNAAPPPRPALQTLPPVNENPQPPAGTASSKPVASSPGTANGPHDRTQFPGSGFNLASAALGTLSGDAATQFLPSSQSPAMAADIDRLGDSAQPVNVPAMATPLVTEASAPATGPSAASQLLDVLPNGSEPVKMEQGVAPAPDKAVQVQVDASKSDAKAEPDIR